MRQKSTKTPSVCWAKRRSCIAAAKSPVTRIGGLTSELNDKQYVGISTGVQESIKTLIAEKSEYKEALVRLIDYYYSEEGYVDGISGPYGVSWEYVDDATTGAKIRKLLLPEEGFKSD